MSETRTFALHGAEWSMVIEQAGHALPRWRHLGLRVAEPFAPAVRGQATYSLDEDAGRPLLPVADDGSFLPPAMAIERADGTPLPIRFDRTECLATDTAIVVNAVDTRHQLTCSAIFQAHASGALVARTTLLNGGDAPVRVRRLASLSCALPPGLTTLVSWHGRHNAEGHRIEEPLPRQGWQRETRGGVPGHGGPPGFYAMDASGRTAIAVQLAWSGNARLAIETTEEDDYWTTVEAAYDPHRLEPGDTLIAPDVLCAISAAGESGARRIMHGVIRARSPIGSAGPRPVHLNSWEAVYFAQDEARMMRLASAAAALGVERFVLDDGWFAGRDDDTSSLGDWRVDERKYPRGLDPLIAHTKALGMQFGLWIEPEMVSPDSDFARAHPDWILGRAEGPTARGQWVLDLTQAAAREAIFEQIDALLSRHRIDYLKWDHNRLHVPSGGSAQVAGSHALLARVREAYPQVEIESCAGGGGRIDAATAELVHRFWPSDNTDPVDRLRIQRSFLAFMPPEMMGAHVGASPNHVTTRRHSMNFRAAIACQGHFGVELDPDALEAAERAALGEWIAFYKRWRSLLHAGEVEMGEVGDGRLWQAQGNGEEWLVWVIRAATASHKHAQPVRLPFARDGDWSIELLRKAGRIEPRVVPGPVTVSGSWLAHHGLAVPAQASESALIYRLKRV